MEEEKFCTTVRLSSVAGKLYEVICEAAGFPFRRGKHKNGPRASHVQIALSEEYTNRNELVSNTQRLRRCRWAMLESI